MPEERIYQIPVWLRPDEKGEIDEARLNRIREELQRLGAKIISETKAAKLRLSYPIKKVREGIFLVFEIMLNPQNSSKVISAFRHNNEILRIGIFAVQKPEKLIQDRQETVQKKPEAKIEELEKKLEEILHGKSSRI